MVFGALVILMPFLGFPSGWDKFFFIVIGILVIGVAYKLAAKPVVKEADKEIHEEINKEINKDSSLSDK